MFIRTSLIAATALVAACSALSTDATDATEERNKQTAAKFYEDLWFSQNTDRYVDYVADTYVVHDLGPRKGVTEEAISQKEIADFFHSFGEMTGRIDYQIADGDKVATRWFVDITPNEQARQMGFFDVEGVAIINVFRFNDEGKIVEIWNHRHDPELPQPPDRPE
ncbi:MAG: ester cyclase [Parvularculaceae bacterium]|nr:ester cyclase [Parvularculaceae bacterium]